MTRRLNQRMNHGLTHVLVLSQRLGNLVATNAIHCLAGVETSATWLQAHFYTSLVFTQQVDK